MNERSEPRQPIDAVRAFTAAWDAHDLEATLDLVTEDCVFESARPDAVGARVVGRAALRDAWKAGFANPSGEFEIEDTIVAGDRVVQLWRFVSSDRVVRGVDVLRVRDGRVAEKFGYVKV
jgi:ketosteroid isomerase-like protein